jgi:hypothetical protein
MVLCLGDSAWTEHSVPRTEAQRVAKAGRERATRAVVARESRLLRVRQQQIRTMAILAVRFFAKRASGGPVSDAR